MKNTFLSAVDLSAIRSLIASGGVYGNSIEEYLRVLKKTGLKPLISCAEVGYKHLKSII